MGHYGTPRSPLFFFEAEILAEILIVSIVLIGFYKICVKCFAKPLLQ